MDLDKFGEGFWVTLVLIFVAFCVFVAAIFKGNPDDIKTIVAIMGTAVSGVGGYWLATRGQTS